MNDTDFPCGLPSLEIWRGTDVTIPLAFTVPAHEDPDTHTWVDAVPIDLTDCTLYFTVKQKPDKLADDTLAIVAKTVTSHTDPTHGLTAIVLNPEDTAGADSGDYLYDIVLKDSGGKLTSYGMGGFQLHPNITRRDVVTY